MISLNLSAEEAEMLRKYFQTSPLALIRLKAQAMTMRSQRLSVKEIAGAVFREERTITRWLKDFSLRRMGSIFSGMVQNEHASKLTRAQKQQIKEVIGQPPDAQGLPQAFWDVPKLKTYIHAAFGVVYESEQSYHFLLKFSGLSFKYPDTLSPRRNEAQISQRMVEIKAEIAPLLSDPQWMVFVSDETRVQLEAEIRSAWLVKGQRTLVKTERSKEHQTYLGFLDQQHGACQVFELERGKQIYVIPVLEKLVAQYPDKNICVIWDNATCHKGQLLREKLRTGNSLARLHLIALPPYAPDHNPIEHVWQYAKKKISNRSHQPFEAIKQAFLDCITERTFLYQI